MLGTSDLKDSKDHWCNVQPLCLWVKSKYQGVIGIYLTNCLIEVRRIMSRPPKKILLPKWWVKWCCIYPFSTFVEVDTIGLVQEISAFWRDPFFNYHNWRVGEAQPWNSPRDFGQNLRPKPPSLRKHWWRDLASLVWGGDGWGLEFSPYSPKEVLRKVENDTKGISLDGNKKSIADILKISTAVVRWYSTKFPGFFSIRPQKSPGAKQLCYFLDPKLHESDNCCFGWITPANISLISQIQIEIKDKKQKRYKTGPWAAALQVFFRFFLFIWGLSQPWNWLKHKWATKRTIAWFWKQRWNYGERPMEWWRPEWELDQLMNSNKHSTTPHFYSRWSSSVFELRLDTLY